MMEDNGQPDEIIANFLGDFRAICVDELAALGLTVDLNDDAYYLYFANMRRRLPARPYRIFEAKGLVCPPHLVGGYLQLKSELAQGLEVTARLSRDIVKGKTKARDTLLYDWGVTHFHLGLRDEQGNVPGDEMILFAIVRADAVYCIGFYDHDSWAKADVMETVHRNWPDVIESARAKGVLGLKDEVTDEEHAHLRNAGGNVLRSFGGEPYLPPGGGQTAARTSLLAHRQADKALLDIEAYEKHVRANPAPFLEKIREVGRVPGVPPRFIFELDDDWAHARIYEPTANVRIRLGPYPL